MVLFADFMRPREGGPPPAAMGTCPRCRFGFRIAADIDTLIGRKTVARDSLPGSSTVASLVPPLLRTLPRHHFDSSRDGELQGTQVAHIVKACGQLRTVTAAMPLPQGALVSVAVAGASSVEVEMAPDTFLLRFGIAGRFYCEPEGGAAERGRDLLLAPGTHFHSAGIDESSLLLALGRRALTRALGTREYPPLGILSLRKHGGALLRADTFAAARTAERLPARLRPKFLLNFQNAAVAAVAALLDSFCPRPRAVAPMIGRRKLDELCQWVGLEHEQPLTVGDLALRCGLGLRALEKNFLRHFDCTPFAYLRDARLRKARRLLEDAEAGWSVTEAALEAGFPHLGRFPAVYQDKFGELPSETAQRARRRCGR